MAARGAGAAGNEGASDRHLITWPLEFPDPNFNMLNALLQRLHELGYTEGQNLAVERQFADGRPDRLRELAAELVRRKPDIIIAFSTTAALPMPRNEQ